MLKRAAKSKSKGNLFLDFMYVIALLGPLFMIPQVILVWTEVHVVGVSFLTWGFLGLLSIFWMVYGIKTRDKPIVVNSLCSIILDFLIVSGVLLHS